MKGKGDFWVWFLSAPLLAYSAYRNLDLVVSTMGNDVGSIVAGLGAIFGLDLGVVLWLMAFNGGRGNQRAVAGVMLIIDLLGAATGLLGDTLMRGGDESTAAFVGLAAGWIIPIVIASNFAAGVLYFMCSPERALSDAEREVSEALELHLAEALKANSKQAAASAVEPVLQNRMAELVAAFGARASKDGERDKSKPVSLNADGADAAPGSKSRKR